jgi:hypothetical protein
LFVCCQTGPSLNKISKAIKKILNMEAAAFKAGIAAGKRHAAGSPAFPPAPRDFTVVDDCHGTLIGDPYRFVLKGKSAEKMIDIERNNC